MNEIGFELLYALVFIVFFVFLKYLLKYFINKREKNFTIIIPEKPDPYEIAYLTKKEKGIISLAIYNLLNRGYLSIITNSDNSDILVGQKKKAPNTNLLTRFENALFHEMDEKNEISVKQMLEQNRIQNIVNNYATTFKRELTDQELIWGEKENKLFKIYKNICIGVFIFLGLINYSRNEGGYLFFFGLFGYFILSSFKTDIVLSSKGIKFIKQMKSVFTFPKNNTFNRQPDFIQQLQIALYGINILRGTSFEYVANYFINSTKISSGIFADASIFIKYTNNSGNSCSSSCGGSSNCGGGCGSGCGGCGGCS